MIQGKVRILVACLEGPACSGKSQVAAAIARGCAGNPRVVVIPETTLCLAGFAGRNTRVAWLDAWARDVCDAVAANPKAILVVCDRGPESAVLCAPRASRAAVRAAADETVRALLRDHGMSVATVGLSVDTEELWRRICARVGKGNGGEKPSHPHNRRTTLERAQKRLPLTSDLLVRVNEGDTPDDVAREILVYVENTPLFCGETISF